jgi:ribokinase
VSASVVVVGSFMTDLVVRAPRRPVPGETIVGTGFAEHLGGKGCNQAVAASRAGATTALVGRVGADEHGRRFLDLLDREGIDATHVRVDHEEGTGVATPLVEPSGANSIVIVPRANHRVSEADVVAADALATADVVLLQLELPLPTVVAAARRAHDAGATVVLNPAPAIEDLAGLGGLEGCVDVLVPNEVEAAALTGRDDPQAAALALQRRFRCAVIVTLGAEGCVVASDDGVQALPAPAVTAVDTVGAGDAFCGTLGARLAAGDDLVTAARYANAAGALSVTVPGAEPSLPTAAQVEALLAADAAVA